jgi:hypothetical protein
MAAKTMRWQIAHGKGAFDDGAMLMRSFTSDVFAGARTLCGQLRYVTVHSESRHGVVFGDLSVHSPGGALDADVIARASRGDAHTIASSAIAAWQAASVRSSVAFDVAANGE